MSASNRVQLLIAFLVGATVCITVSTLVPEDRWTILQWLSVVPLTGSFYKAFSQEYVSFHIRWFYTIAATFHGLLITLILFLAYRLVPRLRRRAWLTLVFLIIVDTVLMVTAFPAGPD
jgi:hypothetical protein